MDCSDLDIFVSVAREGSFAGAARTLGISAASVTRAVAGLEGRLSVRLFTRTTRQCRLTPEGERFLNRCAPLLASLREAEEEVRSGRLGAFGELRVVAPISFGRRHLAPLVAEFTAENPAISVRLYLSDMSDDLAVREFDCALRIGLPDTGNFITRRLLKARRIVCAAPSYLAEAPPLEMPEDLANHRGLVLIRDDRPLDRWMFQCESGMASVQVPVFMASNSGEVTQEWCLAGRGVALKSLWDVKEDVESGTLVEVLAGQAEESADLFVVYPARDYVPTRTRLFIDFATERLRQYGDSLT